MSLQFDQIEKYWQDRFEKQKERTVGFNNQPISIQNKNYQQRYNFIFSKVPKEKKTFDYGCGIGRYSSFFNKNKYLGMDISANLLSIAKKNNPEYRYHKLSQPIPEKQDFIPEMFFTATVLQHNSDDVVTQIFLSLEKIIEAKILLCLYENTSCLKDKKHIRFRDVGKYLELVEKAIKIEKYQEFSHVLHNEKHTLIMIDARK